MARSPKDMILGLIAIGAADSDKGNDIKNLAFADYNQETDVLTLQDGNFAPVEDLPSGQRQVGKKELRLTNPTLTNGILPVKIDACDVSLVISNAVLASFQNFPQEINGNFTLNNCVIKSFAGFPTKVSGDIKLNSVYIMAKDFTGFAQPTGKGLIEIIVTPNMQREFTLAGMPQRLDSSLTLTNMKFKKGSVSGGVAERPVGIIEGDLTLNNCGLTSAIGLPMRIGGNLNATGSNSIDMKDISEAGISVIGQESKLVKSGIIEDTSAKEWDL